MLDYIEFIIPLGAQQHPLRPHRQQHLRPDGIILSKTWSEDTNSTGNEASKGHHEQEPQQQRQPHENPEDTTTTSDTDKEWSDESSVCGSSISSVTLSFGTEHDIYTVSSAAASLPLSDDGDDSVLVWLVEHHQKQQRQFDVFANDDLQTSLSCPTILNEEDYDSNDDDSSLFGLRQQYSLPTTTDNT